MNTTRQIIAVNDSPDVGFSAKRQRRCFALGLSPER
jgi:hypothetical protein